MFSGTPCQVAAITSFLKDKIQVNGRLITVEILCYGVPSPEVFQEHIKLTESKYSKVKKYVFRDEILGISYTGKRVRRSEDCWLLGPLQA